jgi:predicted transporter
MNDEEKNIEEKTPEEDNSIRKIINVAVVIMLVGLVFIALFTFFFSMQEAISVLFHPQYAPLIKAIFSLFIIGVGVYLIKMFLSK